MYEVEFTDMNEKKEDILKTDIIEFDQLFANGGIPNGNSVLVAGGPGTGKSTLCRQICYNLVIKGKKCMYVSFKESKERIEKSMKSFGWDVKRYIEDGNLLIQKIDPLDILRMKFGSIGGSGSAAEISYKIKPLIIPKILIQNLLLLTLLVLSLLSLQQRKKTTEFISRNCLVFLRKQEPHLF